MVTEPQGYERPNKVVVTVDIESTLTPTLELAIALAVASRSNLHGLFIEDMDLLRVASLPFSREVILASGRPRTLDSQQLFRSLNARSRHFRQALERYARQSALVWSYSKVRGRRRSIELSESAEAEFLIIGQPTEQRPQLLNPKRILLITNENRRLYQALDVVLANFPEQPAVLMLISPTNGGVQSDFPQGDLHELHSKLDARPYSSLLQMSPEVLTATLARKDQPVDYVIVSRHDPEILKQVMQSSTCPVIVVS